MAAIIFEDGFFHIRTGRTSYIFRLLSDKRLAHVYYGPLVDASGYEKLMPEVKWPNYYETKGIWLPEINIYDGVNIHENTLQTNHSNGDRMVNYAYLNHTITNDSLTVTLKDTINDIYYKLNYRVFPSEDIMEKTIEVENNSPLKITLKKIFSGLLSLPAGDWHLGYLHGSWASEMNFSMEPITYGARVLESRTGNSSHFLNPSFLINRGPALKEDSGDVYFGQLRWSGNWKFVFEKKFYDTVAFTGGLNDFDSEIILAPSETFKTPGLLLGYSASGAGLMSRNLHEFHRNNTIPAASRNIARPVTLNSWEACYFDLNENRLKQLADKTAGCGAEIFVVDDGWFEGRNDDTTSLGDWREDRDKFPSGLAAFSDYVKKLGLKFGIWFDPEMISPKSNLYKEHPDWCYHFKDRNRTPGRNQLVLNLTLPEVMQFLKDTFKLIIDKYKVDYIKWDMNRNISEAGALNLPPDKQQQIWIKHIEAAYELMDYMRTLNPAIIIEGCAGGGGRYDAGLMAHTDFIWASDNTDPFVRQLTQYGCLLFYPACALVSHIADSPHHQTQRITELAFRSSTAMAGCLGIQADISKWSEENLSMLKDTITRYETIRDTVQFGDLYRFESPYDTGRVSFMYMDKNKNKSVLFAFIINEKEFTERIILKGFESAANYTVSIGSKQSRHSGMELMTKGINPEIKKVQESAVIKIEKFINF